MVDCNGCLLPEQRQRLCYAAYCLNIIVLQQYYRNRTMRFSEHYFNDPHSSVDYVYLSVRYIGIDSPTLKMPSIVSLSEACTLLDFKQSLGGRWWYSTDYSTMVLPI